MKKTLTTALVATATLTLAACGGSTTTENSVVTNEVVLTEGTDNLTAIDDLNATDAPLDNAVVLDNAADAAGNASNAL